MAHFTNACSALSIYHDQWSPNNSRKTPIDHPRYGCLSWVSSLTEILPSNLLRSVQYRVVLYLDISRVYSIWITSRYLAKISLHHGLLSICLLVRRPKCREYLVPSHCQFSVPVDIPCSSISHHDVWLGPSLQRYVAYITDMIPKWRQWQVRKKDLFGIHSRIFYILRPCMEPGTSKQT